MTALAIVADATSWYELAACRGANAELFYPARGETTRHAKAVCARCEVWDECLIVGIAEKHGIWGGKSERERRRLRHAAGGLTRLGNDLEFKERVAMTVTDLRDLRDPTDDELEDIEDEDDGPAPVDIEQPAPAKKKPCALCSTEFEVNGAQKYCGPTCREMATAAKEMLRRNTAKDRPTAARPPVPPPVARPAEEPPDRQPNWEDLLEHILTTHRVAKVVLTTTDGVEVTLRPIGGV